MPDHTLEQNEDALREILAEDDPRTVEEVVDRLGRLAETAGRLAPRGKDDGIAVFGRLYLDITERVLDGWRRGDLFHTGDFIVELDVAFARRYLDALRDHLDGGAEAPGCWALLFDRRQDPEVAVWQFAAAGVNAHVNFDLAFALLDVWEEHETPLATIEAQRADYLAINTIFHAAMDRLIEVNGVPGERFCPDGGPLDLARDFVGDVLVVATRDWAWAHADRYWDHRARPGYRVWPTTWLDLLATAATRAIFL